MEPPADGSGAHFRRLSFAEMKREYAAGNFVRYGELLQQLEKILLPP
jgi:hypothetical protein